MYIPVSTYIYIYIPLSPHSFVAINVLFNCLFLAINVLLYQADMSAEGFLSLYSEKTMFPFPFTVNGIWSWWQFFEPNRISFGSKSKRKLSQRSYSIQFERKFIFLCVVCPSMSTRLGPQGRILHFLNSSRTVGKNFKNSRGGWKCRWRKFCPKERSFHNCPWNSRKLTDILA